MHKEFTVLMSAVLDHEATPAEALRLQEHVATCPTCAQTWHHWQKLDGFLAAAPRLIPPAGFVARVAERLEQQRQLAQRRRWLGSGLLLAWGAIIGLLWLVFILSASWGFSHPLEVGQVLSSGAHVLSGLAWLLRTVQSFAVDLGGVPLSLGLGFYLGLTALVLLLWTWLLLRGAGWLHPLFSAGESQTQFGQAEEVTSW